MLATVVDECELLPSLARGEAAISPVLVGGVIAEFRARGLAGAVRGVAQAGLARLTGRQLGVLELLWGGLGTVEVARGLGISPTTVRCHVSSILARLGVPDRAGAVEAYRAVHGVPDRAVRGAPDRAVRGAPDRAVRGAPAGRLGSRPAGGFALGASRG
jgi:DNA-binding CsgD family transcriptional regulator